MIAGCCTSCGWRGCPAPVLAGARSRSAAAGSGISHRTTTPSGARARQAILARPAEKTSTSVRRPRASTPARAPMRWARSGARFHRLFSLILHIIHRFWPDFPNKSACQALTGKEYNLKLNYRAPSKHRCSCAAGYGGETCNIDIDECSSNPCRNSAACTQAVDSFRCAIRYICVASFGTEKCSFLVSCCDKSSE